ncbi:MAG: O-antigen ligase family protein, partial [Bacteroidetes bacterium]|nr:O-antigen ligase family protein [Bacteroidota bacterium]
FGLPLLYILLLVLSVPLTLEGLGFSQSALSGLSFNLSGPLCLAIAALFFRQYLLEEDEIRTLLWMLAIPAIGVATIALNSVLTTDIYYGLGSNLASSGGYGPNQVSSILGLGALSCFLLAVLSREKHIVIVVLALTLWFLSQATLTLSRGGLFASVLCMVIVGMHLLRDAKKRRIFVGAAGVLLFVGGYYIVPELDSYTYGAVDKRLQDVSTTHRADIVALDLEVWAENPWVGAGPGMSAGLRAKKDWTGMRIAAHTEFSRLLSEHGIAGLVALFILFLMAWRAYSRCASIQQQALVAGFLAWSLAEMTHSAMRLGAVPFLFGLAMVQMRLSQERAAQHTASQPHANMVAQSNTSAHRIHV